MQMFLDFTSFKKFRTHHYFSSTTFQAFLIRMLIFLCGFVFIYDLIFTVVVGRAVKFAFYY